MCVCLYVFVFVCERARARVCVCVCVCAGNVQVTIDAGAQPEIRERDFDQGDGATHRPHCRAAGAAKEPYKRDLKNSPTKEP